MWLGRLWSCDLGGADGPFPQVAYRGRGRPCHRIGHGETARGDGGGEVSGKSIRAGIRSGKALGRQRRVRFYCADERKIVEGSGEVGPCCVERWELQFSSAWAFV